MGKLIDIEAHELRNGDIEKISLVTHGAIRQPFKILKTAEMEAPKGGLTNTLSKIFGDGSSEDSEKAIAALFVRKSVAAKWIPLIKKHGFRVEKEHASLEGDILVLKQDGFDESNSGSVVALNPDVAVQLSSVSKYFDPFPASSSFSDNVAAGSFWPGMHNAMESLAETVWNVLNESESSDTAAADVAKQIKAFSNHLNNLVAELPTTVFKMEQESLTKEFEGSTVSTSDGQTLANTEDMNMSTAVLKEVAAGDLDGLLDDAPVADAAIAKADEAAEAAASTEAVVEKEEESVEKGGDEGAPKSGGSPGNPVVDNTSDTGAVSLDEGGVPEGFRKEERVLKQLEDGKIVEKFAEFLINDETKEEIFVGFVEKGAPSVAEEAAGAEVVLAPSEGEPYTAAEIKLFEAMGVMAKAVGDIKTLVEKQDEKIQAVTKTAEVAKEAADNTVVIQAAQDLDNSLATLRGEQSVLKSEAASAATQESDIFKGLLPEIEGNAA